MRFNNTIKLHLIIFYILILVQLTSDSLAQSKANSEAILVSDSYLAKKDTSISLGVLIKLADGWHIYWKNSGDSGIPTSIEWIVPKGMEVPKINWPIPKAFEFDGLVSYGYENQVLFITDFPISKDFDGKIISISAKIRSLICKDLCIPFDTTVNITIDISKNFITDDNISSLFDQTRRALPILNHTLKASAVTKSDLIYLKAYHPEDSKWVESPIYFIPYENGLFKNTLNQELRQKDNYFELVIEPEPYQIKKPTEVYGLLVYDSVDVKKAYEIKIPLSD